MTLSKTPLSLFATLSLVTAIVLIVIMQKVVNMGVVMLYVIGLNAVVLSVVGPSVQVVREG
jgi:hypothetical protein